MFTPKLVLLLALVSMASCCPPNCNDCDPTSLVCFACMQGYELSVTGSCVDASTVSKCTLYGPTNQCFVCQPTYSLDNNGNCLKSGSPCLVTDPSNNALCTSCGFGTVLQNGQCIGSINCNTATNPCPACINGFSLQGGNCVDGSGNCKTVGNNGICVTCISGYALNGYTCQPLNLVVYACYIRDQNSSCLVCKSGYNLYQGYCLLPSQIQQILQGTSTLQAILLQRTLALTTTTTTTITTTANTNTNNGFGASTSTTGSSGFGTATGSTTTNSNSGFGSFGETSFGGFSGFGGFGTDSSSSSTTTSTASTSTSGFASGFGTTTSSGFGSNTNSGSTTTTAGTTNPPLATVASIPHCSVPDPVKIGECLTCDTGYYIIPRGCAQISPLCLSYSVTGNGNCLSCKYNLQLTNGVCVDQNCAIQNGNSCVNCVANFALNSNGICQFSDPNCLTPLASSCGQCKPNYFITVQGICMLLPSFCLAANPQNYLCIQCANGYILSNSGSCSTSPPPQLPPNCLNANPSNPNYCITCNIGYNSNNGVCQQIVIAFCASYNLTNPSLCLSCISGYTLNNNVCSVTSGGTVIITTTTTATTANRDPNCVKYTGNNCDACSNRYYFGTNGLCVPVNPNCNNYTSTGACTSCFPGFVVSGTNCILSGSAKDPYCRTVNAGGICTSCYANYFYNVAAALCQPLNPLCNSSNLTDGSCLSCYPGYTISGGRCVIYFQDPNCQKFDSNKNCITCSTGYFLNSNSKCQQLSPLCKTSNTANGACTSCYPGYVLQSSSCVVGGATTMDVNCAQFNNGACVKCSNGYFLNANNVCTQLNTLCKTSNTANGACTSCYPGYALQGNNCVISTSSTASTDVNCKNSSSNGICNSCYDGFFLNAQNLCQSKNPLCKTYTTSMSQCSSCFDGYSLFQGQCIISTQVPAANTDQFCIKSQGVYCLTCANGYYLAASGNCTVLNPLCKSSDMATGKCTDCFQGYSLSSGTCIVTAAINIPYCATVVGIVCTSCISGYYVSNGSCALANVLCATYDPYNGTCYSCIPGYIYQDLGCIFPALGEDKHCISYTTGGYCSTCAPKFALVQYICNLIDSNCLQFNNIQNVCVVCGGGKTPSGPNCV